MHTHDQLYFKSYHQRFEMFILRRSDTYKNEFLINLILQTKLVCPCLCKVYFLSNSETSIIVKNKTETVLRTRSCISSFVLNDTTLAILTCLSNLTV